MANSGLTGGQLNLDPETVKQIVGASIMSAIDDDAKERLIAGAIEFLMTPQSRYSGGPKETPLIEVFNQAVHQAAREVVLNEFRTNPELKKAIEDVVHPMVVQLCEGNYDGLPDAVGSAFGSWLAERKPRDD